ncbi:MAG: DUF2231 domain-containing protein [Pseudomonadota bacterium]
MRWRSGQDIHPVHAVLLASSLPLFLGALLSDWAYSNSFEIQWINFAAWLIVGALIATGLALLWGLIDALRADIPHGRTKWIYVALLATTLVLGFVNALVHAKDGWATMPLGLILSVIVFVLAVATCWVGFTKPGQE